MRLLYTFLLLALASISYGQEDFNLELVSNVDYVVPGQDGEAGNDIWGYVSEDGTEYAIVGTTTNTRIYDLSDPTEPREIAVIAGGRSVWRDMKHWEDHVYVTNDQAPDGLLVIDMSQVATDSIRFQYLNTPIPATDGSMVALERCHNIYIDENGFAYLAGCRGPMNRAVIFDLKQNKWDPPVVGVHGDGTDNEYAHDLYVKNNIMYSSEISVGVLRLFDVTDKANIEFLGETATSFNFTHNTWVSDDGNYAFTTDELGNAFVDSYDVSDPSNITRLDRFQPLETVGRGVVPHNTHVFGDFLVTSWYTDGIVITDASRPDNMIKVGAYDTWPLGDGGSNGCWGAYPWLPSGNILANDRGFGLFVLQPNYIKACYLEGTVTDAADGSAIIGVTVEIISQELNEGATNGIGEYKTGLANAGTYDVIFRHPSYNSVEAEAVLENGVLTILDIQMNRPTETVVTGRIISAETGQNIPNGAIIFTNDFERRDFEMRADASGVFSIDVFQESYEVVAGAWGFLHKEVNAFTPVAGEELVIELEVGYQDDFILDQDWTVSGDAGAGIWVRDVPLGTIFGGNMSNIGADIEGDFGFKAYVTGNGPGGAGADDVDPAQGAEAGSTILTSPDMDLTIYDNPVVEFKTYFLNSGGNTLPNDNMVISLTDGVTDVILSNFNGDFANTLDWTDFMRFNVETLGLDINNPITISFNATDFLPGHLVEAGLDVFKVVEADLISTEDLTDFDFISIYPNPTNSVINIDTDLTDISKIMVYNMNGQLIHTSKAVKSIDVTNYSKGMHTIVIDTNIGKSYSSKVVVN